MTHPEKKTTHENEVIRKDFMKNITQETIEIFAKILKTQLHQHQNHCKKKHVPCHVGRLPKSRNSSARMTPSPRRSKIWVKSAHLFSSMATSCGLKMVETRRNPKHFVEIKGQ